MKEWSYPILGLEEAVEGSDCIVVLTDHSEFRELDPGKLTNIMKNTNIVDTRNIIDKSLWKRSRYEIKIIGTFNTRNVISKNLISKSEFSVHTIGTI